MLPNATSVAWTATAATSAIFAARIAIIETLQPQTDAAVAKRQQGRLFAEELHRLFREHAAGDGDWSKRRLGRQLRARNHDLIDLTCELLDRCGVDEPADVAPQDRPHAHRAWFAAGIERRASKRFAAVSDKAATDCNHFTMRGRIIVRWPEIAPAGKNASM